MSSARDVKLGSLSSTLVKRCCLSATHTLDIATTNDCSLPLPHSPHTLSAQSLFSGCTLSSASFNLERSSSTSQHHQDSPMALLPHLPTPTSKTVHIHRIQNAEFGFAARSRAQSFSTLLNISLSWPPETPPRVAQLVMPIKGFKASSQLPHALTGARIQSYISQSLCQSMVVSLVCQYPLPEVNAPYSGCPAHRHYFHLCKKCPGNHIRIYAILAIMLDFQHTACTPSLHTSY